MIIMLLRAHIGRGAAATRALSVPRTSVGRAAFWSMVSRSVAFGLAGMVIAVAGFSGAARAASVTEAFGGHAPGSNASVDHGVWNGLLKTYVVAGKDGLNRVAYGKFKAGGAAPLTAYLKAMQAVDPRKLDRNEQFAFWANLYNAKTIDIVLDRYPVKSIKDISLGGSLFAAVTGGPWKAKVLKVNGMDLSLDDIEHGILRPIFKDPRVHYAVNCASVGCPNLGREAFTGARLDEQLNRGAAAYVNSPRGFKVDGSSVTASSIYKWFKEDFGGNEAGVAAHASRYAQPALKAILGASGSISGYDYDWSLNDAK